MSMDQTVKFLEAWEESAMNDHGYTRTIDMSSALAEPAQSSQRQQQQPAQQSQAPKRQVIRQLMQEECNDEIVLLEERPSHQPHTAYVQGQTPLASSHHQLQMASQDSHQVSHQVSGHPEQSVTYIISGNNSVHPVSQPGPSPGVVRARAPSQTTTGVVNHGLTHELVRNSPELQQQIQQHIAKHQMNQQQQINAKRAIQMGQRNEQQIKQQQAKQQAQLVLQRAQQRQAEHLQQTTSAQLGYVHNLSQGQVITQAGVIQSPAVRMQKQANIISRESLPKPTTVAQKNIIRPARLVVGDGDQVIRHGVSLPHQGSQGVNVQLLQQIREMTATTRMPTGNTRYVPTPGQNVKTPKKKAPPKPKPIKRNNTLNAEILRQALVAGSSNTARTTNVANTSFVTQAGQPLLIPKGTAAQAVQYYIDSGNASLAGSSRVMQIPAQGQGGRAQTVMVNSQGQPVTSQIVRSNNKTIKVVVPSTQVQQLVVQNSSQDQIMVQSPSQGQMVVQSPSQGQMVVQSPSQGQMVVQSPSQGQMVVQSPSQAQMVVQSPSQAQLLLHNPSQAQMVAQSLSQAQMMVQSPAQTQMMVQSSPHTQLVVQSPSRGRMVAQSPSQAQMVVHSSSQAHELSSGSTVVTQNLAYQGSPQYQQALIQTNVPSPGQAMMAGSQVEQSPSCGLRTQSPLVGRGSPLVGRGSQPSFQSPSTGPHHPAPGSAPMALSPVCSQRVSSSSDTNSSKPASPAQQPMSQPKISPLNLHNNSEPEQVMAGKQPGQYVKGQTYAIKYNNGVSLEVIWDGKFFKPKGQCNLAGQVAGSTLQTVVASPGKRDQLSPPATPGTEPPGCLTPGPQTPGASQGDPSGASPAQTGGAMPGATPGMTAAILDAAGQVRGGGGGDKQLQRKVLRGNVTGLNMAGRAQGAPPTNSSMVNGTRKWTHSSVGKDKLSRPPLHPEKQADNEPPKPPRIRKPTEEGKFAVCNHCGNISVDYNDCESCHKPIPDDPKYYYPSQQDKKEAPKSAASPLIATTIPNTIPNTVVYTIQTMPTKADGTLLTKGKFYGKKAATMQIVPPIRTLRATKRRGGATAARGAKRKYVRRVAEPETVTILSSDDEEPARASTSTPTTPGQDTNQPNTPNMAANSTPSATQSRRFKMEDSSGKIVMPLQQSASTPSPTERVLPAMGAQDTAYLQNARSVKLGSLRTVAPRGVHFTPQGICMGLVPEGEEEKTSPVQVALAVDELVHIQVNFGRQFPLMGIYVNPKCAHRLRTKFNMSDKGPFFDPCSNDDSQKRIIILTSEFPKEFIDKVKGLCEHYQAKNQCCTQPLLEEISNQAANNLMMTSAPKAIVNSIKEQQGNIVSRTKTTTQTHTVVGQLVINTQGNNQMTLITTIPVNTEHRDLNEDEEDDEPVDRSRSPSPILNVFSGPIIKLFTFPPPPSTGGITVTNEDLFCLQEGEFLNDVIIDFYLKYLFTKMLSPEDQARTHVFSSFFYRRLTQKDNKRRMGEETLKLTQQERRHHRVRTWTRHVDLFSKDFIIVPINESAHWYLAIVCFPYLKEPVVFKKTMAVQTRVPESVTKSAASKPSSSQSDAEKAFLSDLKGIKEGEPAASVDSSANKVADKKGNAETPSKPKTVMSKIVVSGIEKQPCILVFDSLSGPSRSCVVRTLREYLQVEWDIKKAAKEGSRVFDKDTVKGANPKCPQQTNYSDCGVYVLEYVESFFKRPITDYAIPIRTLADWFTEEQVAAKRQELRDLILKLQKVLNPHLDFEPPPQHVFLSDQQGAALNPQTDLMDHTPIEHTTLKEELPPLKEELSPKEDL